MSPLFRKSLNSDAVAFSSAVNTDIRYQWQIADAPSLRRSQQLPSRHIQIGQSASHKQPVRVLVQPPITHLVEAEDTLEYQKRVFDFRTNLRFGSVLVRVLFTQRAVAAALLVGEVFGVRRMLIKHLLLPCIR